MAREEFLRGDIERVRDLEQSMNQQALLASLDVCNRGSGNRRLEPGPELLLRELTPGTKLLDPHANQRVDLFDRCAHADLIELPDTLCQGMLTSV